MRLRKTLSLLLTCLLVLLVVIIQLVAARDFDCQDCDYGGEECQGHQKCNGYDVQDCYDCDFRCGIWTGEQMWYGPEHDCQLPEA